MKMKVKKRFLGIFLAACMALTFVPMTAFAGGSASCDGGVECNHGAQIGGTHYDTLAEAISAAASGDTIVMLKDYDYPEAGAGLLNITVSCTLDGAGHAINGSGKRGSLNTSLAVNNGGSNDVDVTIKDLTINNSSASGRPLETRGHINSLTLERCKINATGAGNNQAVTIGGNQASPAKLIITDTDITAGSSGYPVLTFNPVDLTMSGGKLNGYCGIYFKGEVSSAGSRGSVANVDGTDYYCPNVHSAGSNDFGVFVLEDDGITVNLTNCIINGEAQNTAQQAIFQFNSYAARLEQPVKVTISGDSIITGTIFDDGWGKADLFDLEISGGQFSDPAASQYAQNPTIQYDDESGSNCFVGTVAEINDFVSENGIKNITVLKGSEITVPKGINVTNATGNNITVNGDQVIENGRTAHIHDFIIKNTDAKYLAHKADCTKPAEYYYSCDCGALGTATFTNGSVAGHTFENGKCAVCGTPAAEVKEVPAIDASKPSESVQVGVDKTNTEKLEQEVASVIDDIINEKPTDSVSKETAEKVKKAIDDGVVVVAEVIFDNNITVTENEKKLANDIKKENETVGTYFDISILLKAGDIELGKLTKLSAPMTFRMSVPSGLIQEGRSYFIIRIHDGVAERLDTTLNDDGTLSFETDRFSTYALAYSDAKAIQTGDNSNTALWIIVMLAAAAVAVLTGITYSRKKQYRG